LGFSVCQRQPLFEMNQKERSQRGMDWFQKSLFVGEGIGAGDRCGVVYQRIGVCQKIGVVCAERDCLLGWERLATESGLMWQVEATLSCFGESVGGSAVWETTCDSSTACTAMASAHGCVPVLGPSTWYWIA
jgi:hypothetical protein